MRRKSKTKAKARVRASTQPAPIAPGALPGAVALEPETLHFFADALHETGNARAHFPGPDNPTFAALAEEFGEVAKALMDLQNGVMTYADLRKECVQVAAMAARVAVEGDPGFPASHAK